MERRITKEEEIAVYVLVRDHASMAIAHGIQVGVSDLLTHTNTLLHSAEIDITLSEEDLNRRIMELQRLSFVYEEDPLRLTERGNKITTFLIYGHLLAIDMII